MVAIREQRPLARKTMITTAGQVSCIVSEEGESSETLHLRQHTIVSGHSRVYLIT